ncbi:MAG: DoxX family protein [Sediminibacterium sp.]
MKTILSIIRWIIGLLFIFSGLIKANDPLGLSYKMQEFFEAWGWLAFHDDTLILAIIINSLEILAGVAVIIGWRMKAVSWLLLLLIIFFTFLTGYALFSGKIKTCGCFGDCLPLTPAQSFGKDLVLLLLILALFFERRPVKPSFGKQGAVLALLITAALAVWAQCYVLKHLPYIDCLPYKKGNNIPDQMKTPAGAVPDSFVIMFHYKKNGKELTFDQAHFPYDFDSTYEYMSRMDKLVKKGNGRQPAIIDFSLQSLLGTDTTAAVFAQTGNYILVLAKDMSDPNAWKPSVQVVIDAAKQKGMTIWLVTADAEKATALFKDIPVLKCDGTVIKTAARAVPTYFVMHGGTILAKYANADVAKVLRMVNN